MKYKYKYNYGEKIQIQIQLHMVKKYKYKYGEERHCDDGDNYGEDAESVGEQSPPGVSWWISGEQVQSSASIVLMY